jgi:hypothetical protein
VQKKYVDAERWYREAVTRFGNTHFAPEAMYWLAVAHYKAKTSKHLATQRVREQSNCMAALNTARIFGRFFNNVIAEMLSRP